ncbi:MAG: glycoside hydrolase family 55 protein [Clostridia bacterium]|nr:glycoside hydrolase family 55 protein [Clostridia bacterium]
MSKKIIAILLCVSMMALLFSGCGKQEKNTAQKFGNFSYSFPYPTEAVNKVEIPQGIEDNDFLSGLNFIDDDTPVIVPEKPEKVDRTPGEPYAVDVKYDDGTGVCVAIYNAVEDFDVCNDGSKDTSGQLQRALKEAAKLGGGVVYLPEGKYLCENNIEIPAGVTLRGEWVAPTTAPAGSCGSVILVRSKNRGRESGSAFMKMRPGSGMRNLTILYPDQTALDVQKYPAAIQEMGGDSFTVMNVTVAGCWNGYQGNLSWSELHYLKNVYISAFNNAIMLDDVTDIGRLEGIRLSSQYFAENAYSAFSKEDQQILKDYMRQYAVGLWMQRSDWEYTYDFEATGLYCAIRQIYNRENRAANAQYCNLKIKDCTIGIDIQATNAIGDCFTDVEITGDKTCQYGVLMNAGFSENCDFQNLRISGNIQEPFACLGNGHMTMVNSTFSDWDENGYALNMHRGSISVQQCNFTGAKKHIQIAKSCGGCSVVGSTFGGAADINYDKERAGYISIDHTPLNLPVTSGRLHVYRRSIPTASASKVYNIVDYGAKNGSDSTAAIKKALEEAGKTGGVVYIPQGEFGLSESVTVPTGVELRGIFNVPTHTATKGSTITTRLGKGKADGEALINLAEGAGVNGVCFLYPEQSYINFIPYPWTVRSLGENCWAINCVFINSYQALDFGTNPSAGHYINYCSGAPLKKGVFVGNNDKNGWVENCQFNPHYWKRADISVKPNEPNEELNNVVNTTLDVFIFGDNKSEHMLGNFAYAGLNLLVLTSQGKGGLNGTIIGHGSDGCCNALIVEEADTVEFINAEMVSMNGSGEQHHITMKPTVTGTVALFNSMMWAQPRPDAIRVYGGRLVIAQLLYYNLDSTDVLLGAYGGETYYCSVMMPPKTYQVVAQSGAKVHLIGDIARQSLAVLSPNGKFGTTILNKGATITEKATWWS